MVRRMPNRSMNEAANGPIRPYSMRLTAIANEMVARDQWNSVSSGTSSTPGVERTPAPISRVRKVTPTTIQP